jgi:tRNA pseudouridine55 synthase
MQILSQSVNGVLLLDKPAGISSNRALQTAKRLLGAAKAGHTGTLDPFATGLLPLCFGEATKFAGLALASDKTYRATLRLGVTTSTGDIEGEVVSRREVAVDARQVDQALAKFVGTIDQIPPLFSAIKVAGKPLYAYARDGESVQRRARRVRIDLLERIALHEQSLEIHVECGTGTYIRALAEDIGTALGCGAHLVALRRTVCAGFGLAGAVSLDRLEEMEQRQRLACLLPVDAMTAGLSRHVISEEDAHAITQGRTLQAASGLPGLVALYRTDGSFLGIGEVVDSGLMKAKRLLAQP